MSLVHLTATEQKQLLTTGKISSLELIEAYLDRIATHNEKVGAYLRISADSALSLKHISR